MIHPGGHVAAFGIADAKDTIPLALLDTVLKESSIKGSVAGMGEGMHDAVTLLMHNRLQIEVFTNLACPPRKCSHLKVESDREGYGQMKRSRFTEEQIIGVLKEQEAGLKVSDLCRKHGISDATFYKWKTRYGGLEVSEAKRLKALEDDNSRLKRLLADAMLDNAALKEIVGKKW